ncbi:MAG: hypothetical protein KJZ78_20745 [Bryobacteraceae bacterium]|nr:hypothetical protein [Bryobacteraceae bacterium]
MATLSWSRVTAAGAIGFAAWQGALWAIPLSILAPCLIATQPTRVAAGATSFTYYAAASVPVIAVAEVYWPSLGLRSILLWITAEIAASLDHGGLRGSERGAAAVHYRLGIPTCISRGTFPQLGLAGPRSHSRATEPATFWTDAGNGTANRGCCELPLEYSIEVYQCATWMAG